MRYFIAVLLSLLTVAAYSENVPRVDIQTTQGTIVLELNPTKAPKSVENFLSYAKAGFYEGTVFHRVIKDFMIQGGGYTEELEKKPVRPPITNESNNGLKNSRGSVALARTNDPNSATAQFFINTNTNPLLDYDPKTNVQGYAVFGKVIQGMEVVDKIQKLETGEGGPFTKDVPKTAVIIKKVTIKSAPATPTTDSADDADKKSPQVEEAEKKTPSIATDTNVEKAVDPVTKPADKVEKKVEVVDKDKSEKKTAAVTKPEILSTTDAKPDNKATSAPMEKTTPAAKTEKPATPAPDSPSKPDKPESAAN